MENEFWYIPYCFLGDRKTFEFNLNQTYPRPAGTGYIAIPATPDVDTRINSLFASSQGERFRPLLEQQPIPKSCYAGFSYSDETLPAHSFKGTFLHVVRPTVKRQVTGLLKLEHPSENESDTRPISKITFDVPKHMVLIDCYFGGNPFGSPHFYLISDTVHAQFQACPLPFYNVYVDATVCLGGVDVTSFNELFSAYWDTPFSNEMGDESDLLFDLTPERVSDHFKSDACGFHHTYVLVEPKPNEPFDVHPIDEVLRFVKFPDTTRRVSSWTCLYTHAAIFRTYATD